MWRVSRVLRVWRVLDEPKINKVLVLRRLEPISEHVAIIYWIRSVGCIDDDHVQLLAEFGFPRAARLSG